MKRLVLVLALVVIPAYAGVNRWTTGGPDGGFVHAIAIDPANATHVFAGTEAGVFRSVDNGETWQPFSDGLSSTTFLPSVTALAFAPSTLYAGASKSVFRIRANESQWTSTGTMNFVGGGGIYSLAVDPSNTNTVYAGVDGGLYKSTNAGATWTNVSSGFSCQGTISLLVDPPNVYAGTCGGVVKSSDGGATWTQSISFAALAFALDGHTIYAGTTDGIFRSTDNGATWTRSLLSLPAGIDAFAIDASGIYAGSTEGGTFKSSDSGVTWLPVNTTLGRVYALAIASTRVFSGTSTGVFRSDDGGLTWPFSSRGIHARRVGDLVMSGSVLYAVDLDGTVLKSTNGGASWVTRSSGIASFVVSIAVDPTTPDIVYASTDDGIYKSVNGGASWTLIATEFVTERLLVARSNPALLYASQFNFNQQFRSTDAAATWTFLGSANARVFAVDPTNANILYAGANRGALKSVDGGVTWTEINNGFDEFVYVTAITATPSAVYAGTLSTGIFKSTDGGAHWTAINNGLSTDFDLRGLIVRAIVVDPTSSSVLYAATDSKFGVFRSLNGGASWSPMNDGLTSSLVHALAIDATGKSLHAATYTGLFDFEIAAPSRRRIEGR